MVRQSIILICIALGVSLLWWFFDGAKILIPLQEKIISTSLLVKGEEAPSFALAILGAKISVLEEENASLKKVLGVVSSEEQRLAAPVIGFELQSQTRILIGKGKRDGVRPGSAVLGNGGTLVGKIIAVHNTTSVVRLIIDPSSKIAGAIMRTDQEVSGVVEGDHSLGIRLTLVPLNEDISLNDIVVSSGQEQGIPRGIPIAKIVEIQEVSGVPLKEAVLTPLADINHLTFVIVVSEISLD